MVIEDDPHMSWIRRLLRGEVVNDEVGIRLRGGLFDGQTQIVRLDAEGNPPPTRRGRRGSDPWHLYRLVADEQASSSWIYEYVGVDD